MIEFCYNLGWYLLQSYCGDETHPNKHSGTSDSVPDFKNTISEVGSSANMEAPMTPKSDIHTYALIYYIWAAIPHRVRGIMYLSIFQINFKLFSKLRPSVAFSSQDVPMTLRWSWINKKRTWIFSRYHDIVVLPSIMFVTHVSCAKFHELPKP